MIYHDDEAMMRPLYRLALMAILFILLVTPALAQDTAPAAPPAGITLGLLLLGLAVLTGIGFIAGSNDSADENSGQG